MNGLESLLALGALDRLPRLGWLQRGIEPCESIAGHILGVAHMALALAPRSRPELDLARVLSMALLHDAAEARSGDLPSPAAAKLPSGAKHRMEEALIEELFAPFGGGALESWREYESRGTPEARFVRLCDRLQLGLCLLGYRRAGRRGLEEFDEGVRSLDCSEFAVLERLHGELLSALAGLPG